METTLHLSPVVTSRPPQVARRRAQLLERPEPQPDIDGPTLVAAYLPRIQEAVRSVSRRRRLTSEEAADLLSVVVIRLLQRNAAILRQFRGDCSIRSFLALVVRRILLDSWISKNGKWRASAVARRLGPVAVALERLVYRDQVPFAEAAETIRMRTGATDSDDELAFLLSLLPIRAVRRFVTGDLLEELHSTEPTPLERLIDAGPASRTAGLGPALASLTAEDRQLLRMRFEKNLTIASIARLKGLDQGRLYRRFARILERLRADIEARGRAPRPLGAGGCCRRYSA